MVQFMRAGAAVCAPVVLQTELSNRWLDTQFVWNIDNRNAVESYAAGKCSGVVISEYNVYFEGGLMDAFCANELVDTDEVVLEEPLAFAVTPNLAVGLSYWMNVAEEVHDITYDNYANRDQPDAQCQLKLDNVDSDSFDELASMTPANLAFPFIVFLTTCAAAAMVHISMGYQRDHLGKRNKKDDVADENYAARSSLFALERFPTTRRFFEGYGKSNSSLEDQSRPESKIEREIQRVASQRKFPETAPSRGRTSLVGIPEMVTTQAVIDALQKNSDKESALQDLQRELRARLGSTSSDVGESSLVDMSGQILNRGQDSLSDDEDSHKCGQFYWIEFKW
jgi:hypothetical protein